MFLLKRRSSSKHHRASSWGSLLDRPKIPPAPVPEIPTSRLDKEPPCIPELGLLARRNSISGGAEETLTDETQSAESVTPPRASTPAPRPSTPARASSPRPSTPMATPKSAPRPCTPARTPSGEKSSAPSTPHYQKARPSTAEPTPERRMSSPPPRKSSPPSRAAALRKSLLPARKASKMAMPETPKRFKDSISAPTPVPGRTPSMPSIDIGAAASLGSSPPSRRPSIPKSDEEVKPPDRPDRPPTPGCEATTTTRRPPAPSYSSDSLRSNEYRLPSASPSDFQRTMERLSLSAIGSRHSVGYGFVPYLPLSESPAPMTPPRVASPPVIATPPARATSPPPIRSYVPLPLEPQATGVSYNEPITRYATPLSVPELPLPQTAEVLTRSTSTGSSGSGVPSLSSSFNSCSESDEDLPPLHRPSLAALEADADTDIDPELPPFNALLLLHNDKPGRKPVPRETLWRHASVAGAPPVPPRRRSEGWRLELLRIVRGFDDVATAKEERDVVRKVGDPGLGEREALNVVRMFVDEIHARVRLGERCRGFGL
ncbi:hypothetical protein A1Q2_04157 [Trichosporon asahii var. asahii CBS 8904]|uniref:Uncharacterized protein n=1 Tax=Trichosporon asahii var. asahii (strain CBS 8904) TaxID=1220162 RepID=K1VLJ7_TRIAC|nr:hypothetical protein A1Q2_04157 [Trichosporon asahii var. asahii CBS 8904]